MEIYIGEVISISDQYDSGRIKVRLLPIDKNRNENSIPYAFPLLPKSFFVKPKVGESVVVLCSSGKDTITSQNTQRYYLGPIISQPNKMYYDSYSIDSTKGLNGSISSLDKSVSIDPNSNGAYPNDDEIAIIGRKDSDIILSDNDIRVRCGCHKSEYGSTDEVTFNRKNPTFIKLKQHDNDISEKSSSSATIVSEEINLISPNGDGYFNVSDNKEQIDDDSMKEIIEKAHNLPYGDVLVDFLETFIRMFKTHTHKYHNMPPCPDTSSAIMDSKYSGNLEEKLLSKHIRIN